MRLIDADKADVEFITCYYADHCYIEDVQEWLDEQPTIEAKPVVHGEWRLNKQYGDYECSACGQGDVTVLHFKTLKMNRCPNCGADMRERKET